ncbi:MAG: hypothetical protein AB7E45_00690 [Candidatus Caldatribacteriota bacterium]
MENHYCNRCEHFKHEIQFVEADKDYQGPTCYSRDAEGNERLIDELLFLCTKANRLIKNMGTESTQIEAEAFNKQKKRLFPDECIELSNRLFADYMSKQKTEIPEWCPLNAG